MASSQFSHIFPFCVGAQVLRTVGNGDFCFSNDVDSIAGAARGFVVDHGSRAVLTRVAGAE